MPKNLRTVYLPANCYKILNYCRLETLKVLKDNNQRGTMICKITISQLIFLNKIELMLVSKYWVDPGEDCCDFPSNVFLIWLLQSISPCEPSWLNFLRKLKVFVFLQDFHPSFPSFYFLFLLMFTLSAACNLLSSL